MRLVSFSKSGKSSFGVIRGDAVIDLGGRFENIRTLREFIAANLYDRVRAGEAGDGSYPLSEIDFEAVIPNPDKIICVGLNYREHVDETQRTVTEKPILFARYSGSQTGHRKPLIKPAVSDEFDFEGELAVVIGRKAWRVSETAALDYIAGYACYNDGSVRDWQRHTSQFLPGKTFAKTGGFGPWLVTADEIPDPAKLTLETRINGVVVQRASVSLLIHSIPTLISYVSTILPLEPGDVLVTGTPGGVGAKRTPPLWMKAGDVAEVDISGIGVLVNPIADESAELA